MVTNGVINEDARAGELNFFIKNHGGERLPDVPVLVAHWAPSDDPRRLAAAAREIISHA